MTIATLAIKRDLNKLYVISHLIGKSLQKFYQVDNFFNKPK